MSDRARHPIRDLVPVDTIPEKPKRQGGGGGVGHDAYGPLLTQVAETPGQTFVIAQFFTELGADSTRRNLTKRIKDGDTRIPRGRWTLESRKAKVTDPETEQEHDGSLLYASYEASE